MSASSIASRSRGRMRTTLLAAGVVALLGAGSATAVGLLSNSAPEEEVQSTIASVFTGDCVTASRAADEVIAALERDGQSGWTVESRASESDCVTAGALSSSRTVVLLPVDHPDVASAMQVAGDELMRSCFAPDEARSLVSGVLDGAGVESFEIRFDGPLAYPIGQAEAVQAHISRGCSVYSGSGRTDDGTPVYFLNSGSIDTAG